MKINIEKIRIDGDTQSRVSLKEYLIQEYTENYLNGVNMTPIKVFFDGLDNWLGDGFHRYHAQRRAKIKEVDCDVSKGTKRDAKIYSWGANSTHGLRRSNEDLRKSVIEALEDVEIGSKSNREIARICKCSDMTVGRIRKELALKKEMGKKSKKVQQVAPVEEPLEKETINEKLEELVVENSALLQENVRLRDAIAIGKLDLPEEEITDVEDTINSLRSELSKCQNELQAMTLSRNDYQKKSADAIQQVQYWKRRAEKAEKAKK
jgi:hypothetical protein